jgi:hypothetical protein
MISILESLYEDVIMALARPCTNQVHPCSGIFLIGFIKPSVPTSTLFCKPGGSARAACDSFTSCWVHRVDPSWRIWRARFARISSIGINYRRARRDLSLQTEDSRISECESQPYKYSQITC